MEYCGYLEGSREHYWLVTRRDFTQTIAYYHPASGTWAIIEETGI